MMNKIYLLLILQEIFMILLMNMTMISKTLIILKKFTTKRIFKTEVVIEVEEGEEEEVEVEVEVEIIIMKEIIIIVNKLHNFHLHLFLMLFNTLNLYMNLQ